MVKLKKLNKIILPNNSGSLKHSLLWDIVHCNNMMENIFVHELLHNLQISNDSDRNDEMCEICLS